MVATMKGMRPWPQIDLAESAYGVTGRAIEQGSGKHKPFEIIVGLCLPLLCSIVAAGPPAGGATGSQCSFCDIDPRVTFDFFLLLQP